MGQFRVDLSFTANGARSVVLNTPAIRGVVDAVYADFEPGSSGGELTLDVVEHDTQAALLTATLIAPTKWHPRVPVQDEEGHEIVGGFTRPVAVGVVDITVADADAPLQSGTIYVYIDGEMASVAEGLSGRLSEPSGPGRAFNDVSHDLDPITT